MCTSRTAGSHLYPSLTTQNSPPPLPVKPFQQRMFAHNATVWCPFHISPFVHYRLKPHICKHISTEIQKVCRAGPLWLGFHSLVGTDGAFMAFVSQETGHWHMEAWRTGRWLGVRERILPYRKHGGGEKTPRKKLQEDDHHGMVNTRLADSLRLRGEKERWLGGEQQGGQEQKQTKKKNSLQSGNFCPSLGNILSNP